MQHVWPELTGDTLAASLPEARRIYTYNGNCFDLKVVRQHLGVDLLDHYKSRDLMYDCRQRGLTGGLKAVERLLGIERSQPPLSNAEIQQCWTRWKHRQDEGSLRRLLKYNEEDVMNLVLLRERLGV
ncbi:MAG: exonuclease [Gaiellales bacterium]|nr:MAG: exonuclease [Gaiellales bacterium]